MTKRDLVVKIARETGFIQNDVAEVVQKTLDYIAEDLIAGNPIELRNFGVFEIKDRTSRKGRTPHQPKTVVLDPARAARAARVASAVPDGAAEAVVCTSLRKGSEV